MKNEKVLIIFPLLLFCFTMSLPAGGGREKSTIVKVTGTVRLVGSSPVSEIVISGESGQWYIAREEAHKFMDLQHQTITVEGAETVEKLTLANGQPAGERRTLKKTKLVSVK